MFGAGSLLGVFLTSSNALGTGPVISLACPPVTKIAANPSTHSTNPALRCKHRPMGRALKALACGLAIAAFLSLDSVAGGFRSCREALGGAWWRATRLHCLAQHPVQSPQRPPPRLNHSNGPRRGQRPAGGRDLGCVPVPPPAAAGLPPACRMQRCCWLQATVGTARSFPSISSAHSPPHLVHFPPAECHGPGSGAGARSRPGDARRQRWRPLGTPCQPPVCHAAVAAAVPGL